MHLEFGKECEGCKLLRDLLEEERTNNRRLMDRLLSLTQPESQVKQIVTDAAHQPIQPKTWRMRKELLEAEDRKQAELIRNKKIELKVAPEQSIEELEKELGVDDNARNIG